MRPIPRTGLRFGIGGAPERAKARILQAASWLSAAWPHFTLRRRVALIVFATSAPLLLFNLVGAVQLFERNRAEARQQALYIARTVASVVENDLRGRLGVLEVLGTMEFLRAGNFDRFREVAIRLVRERFTAQDDIFVIRADGQQLVNTAVPAGKPLPMTRNTAFLTAVLQSGRPRISDLIIGTVSRKAIFNVGIPVRTAGGDELMLAMSQQVASFDASLRRYRPNERWALSVLDGNAVWISRVPALEGLVGRAAPQPLPREIQQQQEGIFEADMADGTPGYVAFAHLGEPAWIVTAAVPRRDVILPALWAAAVDVTWTLAFLVLGLVLATAVSHSITAPLMRLRRFATAPERIIRDPSVTVTGLPETDEVAKALFLETRQRIEDQRLLLQSERRLQLVIRELNHRAKNALTTVQALAYQTARSGFGEETRRFVALFSDRLGSLAAAHDLLTAHAWDAIGIEKVVSAGLAPWMGGGAGGRIILTEAALPVIAPRQAQALMLAFHELATNATKYGALSVPEGSVEVRAHVEGAQASVEWIERGGPPVPGPPTRKGFGTHLMEKLVRRDLGDDAAVTRRFEPSGLVACFRFTPVVDSSVVEPSNGESHGDQAALPRGGRRGDDRGHARGIPERDRPRSRCLGCDLPKCGDPCTRE
ncbi:HWE_HK domain-containing protein [Rhodovastum atsumiense]|uniref:histidine kinase n=1 Tax=Rhodovastum atsumiense TaxID=504468 RepID=A0A5M6ISM4_9PROT|nr:sensor histidine kinase [Rhodovastum atsumiense]KAA5611201.1 hypothetical protein F1189_15645 [Rhodovastum atsumiense]CAH2602491.1 HWE_HK domain-containing protein [Rhodovastum atsumiense]